jgi:predicted DNA-binding transcriptional regulator YafY
MAKNIIIHPYYLKQYNKRWFLFGLNNHDQLIYNLPLDRIACIKPDSTKFIKNSATDFTEYFEDIVGVSFSANSKPIKILLQLDKEIAPYILTKPIHGSQKRVEVNDKGIIIQIEVIPNIELKQLLLSYGSFLKILSPEVFRTDFVTTINEMQRKYND